jgi:uncharacterized protein YutE (UPF0331/DUF86 family)
LELQFPIEFLVEGTPNIAAGGSAGIGSVRGLVMSIATHEERVLESIMPRLEADGYDVYMHPPASLLPPFMEGYVPDMIALGRPKNLAIEIVSEASPSSSNLGRTRQRFEGASDWELRVYYIRPTSTEEAVETVSTDTIEDSLRSIDKLVSDRQLQPALLMAWATLEALGRALLPDKLARPQSAGLLVEALASDGLVTPTEADVLRRIAKQRNRIAHGNLKLPIQQADLDKLSGILKTLLGLPASR